MTNEEKLREVFPKTIFIYRKEDDKTAAIQCSNEWLNAEYKEPTTKNNLGVDCVSRQAVLDLIADYDLSMGQVVRGIHALPSVTPQEPIFDKLRAEIEKLQKMCDKNDLNLMAQYSAFGMVLDILDKYKAESEG